MELSNVLPPQLAPSLDVSTSQEFVLPKVKEVEQLITSLLEKPLRVPAPSVEKNFDPPKKTVWPEMYIRRLTDGGYVVGIEIDVQEHQKIATGLTLEEALLKLKVKLGE